MADGVRKRALRAARVATMGLVLATPGCYQDHSGSTERDAALGDSGLDAVADAAFDALDAGSGDAGPIDDAAVAASCVGSEDWVACCEAIGWDWDRGCAAWGPFVPPGEVA